jgi:hypothetical protein
VGEAASLTGAPTLRLSFACASSTFSQTCPCDFALRAASFRSRVAARSFDELKWADASAPRFVQRPCSTQNAEIAILPECGHDQIDGEHPILLPALDDVARLDEDLLVREVFDCQLVDALGLVDDDLLRGERLGERQEVFAFAAILAVEQEDGEVLVGVGAGDGVNG